MADSILRLKVESQEYDNKLKQAAQGLTRYVDECRKVGGTLEVVEKETLDYVRAIGQMDTTSRTATGKLAEMKKTFTELSAQYRQLTDAEKQSPFGKALAGSLDTLKGRVAESKSQLDDINKSINGSGGLSGALDAVAGKFGLNIEQVTKFGGVVGVATTALTVAKDAFFNNEEQLDEWGRVVESSHSLYTGFLNALNTGDISGYLSNINHIVQAARDAYDALDALGTYNAFNQINVERTRTNMTESIADYRGGKGSKDAVKAAGEAYKKELKDRKRLENEAYLAAVKRVAAERGISAKDLTDALSGTYGHYQDLKNVQPTGVRQTVVGAGMFARTGTETFAQTRQEKLGEALRHLNDTELQSLQALGAQAQRTGNEIAQVDKQLTRVLNSRQPRESGGGGKGVKDNKIKAEEILPVGSVAALTKEMQELRKEQNKVTNVSDWRDYEEKIKDVNNRIKELKGELGLEALRGMKGVSVSDGVQLPTRESILKKGDAAIKNFKTQDKPTKQETKLSDVMGQMNSGISSMVSGIEGLGIELPKGMKDVLGGIQSVTTILSGISTIVAAIEAINAADTIIPFASGGVVKAASGYTVPGRRFSGDMIPARLNAGELVLNQAQAGVIANALQDRDFSGGSGMMQPYVDGEKIFLGMNNTSKRMGRGEIVTTSTLRRLGLI